MSPAMEFFAGQAGDYYVCLGYRGSEGICRLNSWPEVYHPLDDDTDLRWQFLFPGSDGWEIAYRLIYRENWARRIAAEQLLLPLPTPLPDPFFANPEWIPAEALPTAQFSRIASWLLTQPSREVRLTLVFAEDLYESKFGDGRYLYLHRILLPGETSQPATTETTHNSSTGTAYHFVPFTLSIQYEQFHFPHWRLGQDEQYTPQSVMRKLEERWEGKV